MEKDGRVLDFFLGANSPAGFAGYFKELTDLAGDRRCYIIKGGPGTGKSSLMKRVAQALEEADQRVERIHCSSDPNSLDGVIGLKAQASIADGTAPHVLEPAYPGAYHTTVNLQECWDETQLYKNRGKILDLFLQNKALHTRCTQYLKAAKSLLEDNECIAAECTNFPKISLFVKRLIHKELPRKKSAGVEHKRLLSAVTPLGIHCYGDTVSALCDRVYVIKDDFGAASRAIFDGLRKGALDAGYEIYTCYCPLEPLSRIEHLLIPELRLGFVTSNKFVVPQVEPFRAVNFSRFTDIDALRKKKQRLSFNKKAASELFEEAVRTLQEAKRIHDLLEHFYMEAMDFSRVEEISQNIVREFENRCLE